MSLSKSSDIVRLPRRSSSQLRRAKAGRSDATLAALAGLAAFAVYLRTLAPDLSGYEDTPKFQYLGSVLGTAHPPGYPLHSLLSYVFSWIPIGTIAYRANLMSAFCGAVAVAFGVRLAREFGIGRIASVAGAWTIAFSLTFWRYSVLAEVYTLAAALLAAVIYWLVRWDATSQPRHLYFACIAFALALGNHLSIVATAPGILWFLWKTRARPTLTFGRVILAGVMVFSGMLQVRARLAADGPERRLHRGARHQHRRALRRRPRHAVRGLRLGLHAAGDAHRARAGALERPAH